MITLRNKWMSFAIWMTRWQFRLGYQHADAVRRATFLSKALRRIADGLGVLNGMLAGHFSSSVDGSQRVMISMCTYQGAAWVDAAIGSAMDLGYTNWHLYIVDDGSTDATPAMLKRWQKEHPDRITLNLLPENTYPSNTTNESLAWFLAHPEFDVFHVLDQDDVLLPDGLQTGLSRMGPHCQVVRCRNARFDAQLSEWFYDFDATAQLFIAREAIERVGFRTERSVEHPSDTDYLRRLFEDAAAMGCAILSTRKVCQKMRVHGSNQFLHQRTKSAARLRKKLGIDHVN